ncbi:hypothetical protein AVEN_165666-1 [Araneus ventricosus]|uniref:Uncharacterized protein n=1 Tax=Araneus ventricosus TaxID=182803 RepID=A0A4Y2LL46_ARAVE|nr:hypothetical protein AVEN_165666-1 [Araneus ventricosus]
MIPENATLFSIFLLGKGIHEKTPCEVTACRREYLRKAPRSEERLDRLGSPWSPNAFGFLPAVRAGELSAIEEKGATGSSSQVLIALPIGRQNSLGPVVAPSKEFRSVNGAEQSYLFNPRESAPPQRLLRRAGVIE